MNQFSHSIIKHRRSVLIAFVLMAILSGVLMRLVSVNYNLVDYLPKDSQSTQTIKVMQSEFGSELPNARVMLMDVTLNQALATKAQLEAIDGVTAVTWLDDIVGLDVLETTPLDFMDASLLKEYYKEGNALMSLTIENGKEKATVSAIYALIGETNATDGDAISKAATQNLSVKEVTNAMGILVPIIVLILILTTTSWIEPLFFMLTIGIAIVLNMGTDVIFTDISFITKTVSPVLQLAVSLDYAIFLLHSFNDHRLKYEPKVAMKMAMKQSFPTIAASAATTMIGFSALIFMRFGIGADLGLNLLKGVTFSFVSVMIFLPVITLIFHKVIDKTKHRPFMPKFKVFGKWLMKVRLPFLILALLVVVPSFLAQANTTFLYGMGSVTGASRVGSDSALINEKFGKHNTMVLLVPKDSIGKEAKLCEALSDLPHISNVLSYTTAVGAEIPTAFVPQAVVNQFYSEHYARIIIYSDTAEEGANAFKTVETLLETTALHYDSYYLTGASATLYDMKKVVSIDVTLVNLIAIMGIFIVLLITFRSLVLPLLLLFTIETAIWINLAIPYFTGQSINFIGYLIVSTVQLGATVDYAILFTNSYLTNRKSMPKQEAMRVTIEDNLISILVSAIILSTAGFTLMLTTSNPIIGELGILIGRGTLLSLTMVSCVLPALLVLFDKIIQKTTHKNEFHQSK